MFKVYFNIKKPRSELLLVLIISLNIVNKVYINDLTAQ